MKKTKLLNLGALALVAASVVGCGPRAPEYTGEEVQGVTETEILIGNTAAASGAFATVGQPFNIGLNAALKVFNDKGGYNGKKVRLIHHDDGFNAETGLVNTKKLVEEDKVFALVGHFGTPTVGATLDYIGYEKGIPMVYAATGISGLYNVEAQGYEKAIMSVQPIYNAEGRVLLARAVAATEGNKGLGATKVGVISTKDEAGIGMLDGIKTQAKELKVDIKYVTTDAATGTNHAAAVNALKTAGCDVIVIAANQAPFQEIMSYMKDGGLDNVKVITSYVSANAADLLKLEQGGAITATREVYTAAWLDITDYEYKFLPAGGDMTTLDADMYLYSCYGAISAANLLGVPGFSKEYWDAAVAITDYMLTPEAWLFQDGLPAFHMSYNSYALAGYIAGTMFCEGLDRVKASNQDLTWLNYINAMESSPIDIPMGGGVDYANGARLGITDLALNKYDMATDQLVAYSGITSLDKVMEAVPADKKK